MMNPITLAMWSGPRNISTAMMRSWGNRADTVVVDEPLYAYYPPALNISTPVQMRSLPTTKRTGAGWFNS